MLNFRGFWGINLFSSLGKRVSFDNPPPKSPSAREGEFLEAKILPLAFHPFDFRYTYYSDKQGFLRRSCYDTMLHFVNGENLGLCFPKTCLNSRFDYGLVINTLADRALGGAKTGSETCIAPLYIYKHEQSLEKQEAVPNFTREFAEFKGASELLRGKSPEQILAYIYARLYAPRYRERYLEYLKIGFPRVNFSVSAAEFDAFERLGQRLLRLHLGREGAPNGGIGLEFRQNADKNNTNFVLEKMSEKARFVDDAIILNRDLQVLGVSEGVWGYSIGGYLVLKQWLKYRVGKALSQNELEHFVEIARILKETIALQSELNGLGERFE